MTYADAIAALEQRSNYERSGRLTSPSRDRIEALMDVMAQPQRAYPSMHITGTVGKTTTAHVATEALRAAGLSVGTYVSPHVGSVRERILFDGRMIDEEEFETAWDELTPYLELVDQKGEQPVTWFEATTALAFVFFAEKSIDVAVIEVGMGGTWDATNVIDASVAVFTPIAVDHADILGATPATIAREKAGIVKPNAIVYTVAQEQAVADVLRARCDEVGAEIRAEPMAFELESASLAFGGQNLNFRIERERYRDVFMPMFGEHAARDAVLGAAAARSMLGEATLEHEVILEAFGNVRVPGRLEVVHRQPLVVLDGAHNGVSAQALAAAMPASFRYERLTIVVSAMADKDLDAIVAPLAPLADMVIVTANESPRAARALDLAERVRVHGGDVQVAETVADALARAIERSGEADAVLVTGSLYTVGEARDRFL